MEGIYLILVAFFAIVWVLYLKIEARRKDKEFKKVKLHLEEHSYIDSLTGLYNWRYFFKRAEETIAQAQRNNFPVSLIKLDIDLFKNINRIYGPLKGDKILKEFSEFLKKNLRASDIICRLEDDEFGIICLHTDKNRALKLLERLQENLKLVFFGEEKINLQINIGIVVFPEDSSSLESLLSLLDRCLDYSKIKSCEIITLKKLEKGKDFDKEEKNLNLEYLKEKVFDLKTLLEKTTLEAIIAFANTIKAKDLYTAEHTERTVRIAINIAKELGLDDYQIEVVKYASMLHDLGKVGIPEAILKKPGKLTPEEFNEVKKHPIIGAEILRPLHSLLHLIPSILYHHERVDGGGYPYGLKDNQIPLEAKIVALADTFQALTSDRPYRKAYSIIEAQEIIEKENGSHFDPQIVEAFRKTLLTEELFL